MNIKNCNCSEHYNFNLQFTFKRNAPKGKYNKKRSLKQHKGSLEMHCVTIGAMISVPDGQKIFIKYDKNNRLPTHRFYLLYQNAPILSIPFYKFLFFSVPFIGKFIPRKSILENYEKRLAIYKQMCYNKKSSKKRR